MTGILCYTSCMSQVLKVSSLKVVLDGETIIQNLSFELQEKETLLVLGPNGAGKTVLLRALLGLIPHEGEVQWRQGSKIGYVPQRVPLNKELPVTVSDFFELKGVSLKSASSILAEVGIAEKQFLDKQLGVLSFGQFQRVLIAWALSKNPDVLLLDEPTAGVDVSGEETIQVFLRRIQEERKLSIILITHDVSAAQEKDVRVLALPVRA